MDYMQPNSAKPVFAGMTAALALCLLGCEVGIPCEPGGKPCPGDGVCHPEQRVCVTPGDGGAMGNGNGDGDGNGNGNGNGNGDGSGNGDGTSADCMSSGVSCTAWEVCVQGEGMAACADAGYQLRWVSPNAGAAFNTASAPGRLEVQRANGGTVALTKVPVSGAEGGHFTGGMGTYSGTLRLGEAEGEKAFVAGWAEGPTAELTVTLDKTPPQVDVQVEGRPASLGEGEVGYEAYWKKDEAAAVRVTVTGGPMPKATQLITAWGAEVREGQCTGACTGNCRCFAVPLDGAPLMGLRGEARFAVEGVMDAAGNTAAAVDAGIQLTRFKWQRTIELPADTTPILSPALTEAGVVLWGARDAKAAAGARLVATRPDGGKAWEAITAGTITAGPLLAGATAWVGVKTGTKAGVHLQPLAVATGTAGTKKCIAAGDTATAFTGTMAVAALGTGDNVQLVPLAMRGVNVNAPVGGSCYGPALTGISTTEAPHIAATAAATAGEAAVFVASEGNAVLWKAVLSSSALAAAGKAPLPTGTRPRGLFFDGMGRVGGGGGATGTVFTGTASGSLESSSMFTSTAAANAGAPVLGGGFVLWGDSVGKLHRASYTAGNFGSNVLQQATGAGNLQEAMPLLGAGGRLYVIGAAGKLSVHRSETLQKEWQTSLATLSGAGNVSQMALDVSRKADGTKDCTREVGLLYLMTRSGKVGTLHALVVDSPGLDGSAPWPKYQRDNSNRGNSTLPTTPWTCPTE